MGIDVVGSVLCVVLEDEEGGVVPVGAAGDGFNGAPDGEIVVCDACFRRAPAWTGAESMVVRQAQHDEGRHLVLAFFALFYPDIEMSEELVDAELIGKA